MINWSSENRTYQAIALFWLEFSAFQQMPFVEALFLIEMKENNDIDDTHKFSFAEKANVSLPEKTEQVRQIGL